MSHPLEQRFPVRQADAIVHQTWIVDLDTAVRVARGTGCSAGRLHLEVTEMGTHLPRWILTPVHGQERIACAACGGMLVFDRGLRCIACDRRRDPARLGSQSRLGWFGLLPPIGIDSLARVKRALNRTTPTQHIVGSDPQIGRFLLVPLLVSYPPGFPNHPPQVCYLPAFFQIAGMPPDRPSHAVHLYGSGAMCLFAGGEWRAEMTCRQVLEQRAYAHVVKLLNYANGKRTAFAKVS
jgi:hypothetical protein